jgi:hypothetical protein
MKYKIFVLSRPQILHRIDIIEYGGHKETQGIVLREIDEISNRFYDYGGFDSIEEAETKLQEYINLPENEYDVEDNLNGIEYTIIPVNTIKVKVK